MTILDGDISLGILGRERTRIRGFLEKQSNARRKSTRSSKIPSRVKKYAARMAEISGVSFETALNSSPVQNYWRTWNEQRSS